jgi:hypothetical protein
MFKTILGFFFLSFVYSCANNQQIECKNLSEDSSTNSIEINSLKILILGEWERYYFKVYDNEETIYADSLRRDYFLIFQREEIFIEKSSESNDTLSWVLENDPLRIILSFDYGDELIDYSKTLFIEEVNDSILKVYSETSLYPEAKAGHIVKQRMKFSKILNEKNSQ